MLQVIQPIDGRSTEVVEIPTPSCGPNQILIANRASLVSAGTERSTIDLAKQSLLAKARSRPDHVARVLQKVRQEGLLGTIQQVRAKLGQPIPLGYSSAGVVIEVGKNVTEFKVGDRVASNGPHAGVVAVPKNLAAKIPDGVSFDDAAYAVIGAIGLQGVRLAKVGLGDIVLVIGLGLIGQITVGLLRAAGCTVVATDLDPSKRTLAETMGADTVGTADEIVSILNQRYGVEGADVVIITASTKSNQPIELAGLAVRKKGRVVAVGAVGLDLPRRSFYPKEAEFVVSCSYGPGRYDPAYEEQGRDYPYAYVRWTEQRNIAAVLQMIGDGKLPVSKLTSHRFPITDALSAYQLFEQKQPYLGVIIDYPEQSAFGRRVDREPNAVNILGEQVTSSFEQSAPRPLKKMIGVSLIGSGSFANATLVPAFLASKRFALRGICSAAGLSARTLTHKVSAAFTATDPNEIFSDEQTDAVIIATRHDQHADLIIKSLLAGKHVFVEKPLAITHEQTQAILDTIDLLEDQCPLLMVGYNRRFSPLVRQMREQFANVPAPKCVTIRMNAGPIPAEHWTQDLAIGGGRIVGEACHGVDLAIALTGSQVASVTPFGVGGAMTNPLHDNVQLMLRHVDGSITNLIYTSGGDRSAGKERVEMFAGEQTGYLDDFRSLEIFARGKCTVRRRLWSQQKGYAEEVLAFADAVSRHRTGYPGTNWPIPLAQQINSTKACLLARDLLMGQGQLSAQRQGSSPGEATIDTSLERAERESVPVEARSHRAGI